MAGQSTFGHVLKVSELEAALDDGDWVVARPDGQIVEMEIPKNIGPATMMVRAVTDALKSTDGGLITGSIDRGKVWAVEAFALNRVVVQRLEGEELTVQELHDQVVGRRLAWQMSEIEGS